VGFWEFREFDGGVDVDWVGQLLPKVVTMQTVWPHTHKKDISPAPFCFLLLAVAFALLMLFPCSHFCFVSFIWSCFPFFFAFWPPMSDAYQQRTWPRIRSICLFSLLRPKCIYSGMSFDGREN